MDPGCVNAGWATWYGRKLLHWGWVKTPAQEGELPHHHRARAVTTLLALQHIDEVLTSPTPWVCVEDVGGVRYDVRAMRDLTKYIGHLEAALLLEPHPLTLHFATRSKWANRGMRAATDKQVRWEASVIAGEKVGQHAADAVGLGTGFSGQVRVLGAGTKAKEEGRWNC